MKNLKVYLDNCCLNRLFDYTKWRRDNLCVGMSIDEIDDEAMKLWNETY